MKVGISLKIDVSKIDKTKLYKGAKGTYLDLTAFVDLDGKDQYGKNGMVTQSVSKEDKAAGVRGEILGNSVVFWSDSGQQQAPSQSSQPEPENDFDAPF